MWRQLQSKNPELKRQCKVHQERKKARVAAVEGWGVGVEECSELRLERQAGAGIDWALSFLPTLDP